MKSINIIAREMIPFGSSYCPFLCKRRPENLYFQNFGLPLSDYLESGVSSVKDGEKKYEIILDTSQFNPDELKVNFSDGRVTIEGEHEERDDAHGKIYRHFKRVYSVPDKVKTEDLKCKRDSNGVLVISAPKLEALKGPETNIPIQME